MPAYYHTCCNITFEFTTVLAENEYPYGYPGESPSRGAWCGGLGPINEESVLSKKLLQGFSKHNAVTTKRNNLRHHRRIAAANTNDLTLGRRGSSQTRGSSMQRIEPPNANLIDIYYYTLCKQLDDCLISRMSLFAT